jgi:hypothetical protein
MIQRPPKGWSGWPHHVPAETEATNLQMTTTHNLLVRCAVVALNTYILLGSGSMCGCHFADHLLLGHKPLGSDGREPVQLQPVLLLYNDDGDV